MNEQVGLVWKGLGPGVLSPSNPEFSFVQWQKPRLGACNRDLEITIGNRMQGDSTPQHHSLGKQKKSKTRSPAMIPPHFKRGYQTSISYKAPL